MLYDLISYLSIIIPAFKRLIHQQYNECINDVIFVSRNAIWHLDEKLKHVDKYINGNSQLLCSVKEMTNDYILNDPINININHLCII